MSENRTITVTGLPNDYNDVEFTIDHYPGGQCTVWWECKVCADYTPTEDEMDESEYARHGEKHQNARAGLIDALTDPEGHALVKAIHGSKAEG